MASVFAVVSKKVFETQARRGKVVLGVGDTWDTARYASAHASFNALKEGGDLFLVTVRPPDEKMWLVAVLRSPTFDGEGWTANANAVPILDISQLRKQITFASGAGITAEKGKLGMSLQTPRALAAPDVALLHGAAGIAGGPTSSKSKRKAGELIHLNAHDKKGPLPCLCVKCLKPDESAITVQGLELVRASATAKGRVLHYWLPKQVEKQSSEIRRAVEGRLQERYRKVKE